VSAASAELTLGFNAATVLEQVRWLPQVRLDRRMDGVTAVVSHERTIAVVDGAMQRVEIAVSVADVERVLAEHPGAERGPNGVTVQLTSAGRVQTAVELIRQAVDEALYHWQRTSANP